MNILRESMTKVGVGTGFGAPSMTVRIWREEKAPVTWKEHEDLRNEVLRLSKLFGNSSNLAEAILNLPRVAAVEIINAGSGNGEVLYRCDEVMIGDKRLTII